MGSVYALDDKPKCSNTLRLMHLIKFGLIQVTWNDVREFLDSELRDRPFEPHELLMKLRFIDETSSGMSTLRRSSFQSEFLHRISFRNDEPAYL